MPVTASAKKALRRNLRQRAQNLKKKEVYRRAIKEYRKLIASKKLEEAQQLLSRAYQALDKAAKTSVIKKNTASRLKSRLTHLIAKSSKTSS